MKTALCLFALSLAVGGSASAAERKVADPHAPPCLTVAKLKADMHGAKFTPMNIGQFHFSQGVYVATPPTSVPPTPAADNAIIVQIRDKIFIVWMKAECGSVTPPTLISPDLLALIKAINPVAGETSDAPDDTSQDMHL